MGMLSTRYPFSSPAIVSRFLGVLSNKGLGVWWEVPPALHPPCDPGRVPLLGDAHTLWKAIHILAS